MDEEHQRELSLSGFSLKAIALFLMVLDHIYEFFQPAGAPIWLTWLGRISAPIFCFMIVEGFTHTHNVKKYLIRLYVGYVVMGVGNLILMTWFPRSDGYPIRNNIFGLFFLMVVYMLCLERLGSMGRTKAYKQIPLWLLLMLLPFALTLPQITLTGMPRAVFDLFIPTPFFVEGSLTFLFFGVMLYVLRKKRMWLVFFVLAYSFAMVPFDGGYQAMFYQNYQWLMVLSLPFIQLYNGKRGLKYQGFFYWFYPLHVWILFLLSRWYL
jgi:hypothetical protein